MAAIPNTRHTVIARIARIRIWTRVIGLPYYNLRIWFAPYERAFTYVKVQPYYNGFLKYCNIGIGPYPDDP